jgi:histidinol-phosphate aminotransferase
MVTYYTYNTLLMTITLKRNRSPHFNKTTLTRTAAIRLDQNENPLGASPLAIKAAQQALLDCHRYPDHQGYALKASLATHLDVPIQTISLGNGSEDLLALIGQSYLNSKNSAVLPNYSFIGIEKIIRNTGAQLRIADNSYDYTATSQILSEVKPDTKVIFIVNPNNPTGTYINSTDLNYLLDSLPAHILVVIDEAYAEYVETSNYPDTIKLLKKYPNLVICRTFSKFYGLAGLRVGYTISHPEIASHLRQLCLPFAVNSIALVAAQAALGDQKHRQLTHSINQKGLNQLRQGLKNLSLSVNPSYTNFICVDLKQNSLPLYKQLLHYGIWVRPLHDYGLPHHLRISIGLEKQNQQLLEALEEILSR